MIGPGRLATEYAEVAHSVATTAEQRREQIENLAIGRCEDRLRMSYRILASARRAADPVDAVRLRDEAIAARGYALSRVLAEVAPLEAAELAERAA